MASLTRTTRTCAVLAALLSGVSLPALAEPQTTKSYNLYGTPGLLEMPTAEMAEDAELAFTYARVGTQQRSTLTFQLLPRISGSFRYAKIPSYDVSGDRFDRSFDIRFQLLEEGVWVPAVSIGLQDLIGTGVYSAEYIVATKGIGDRLRITGGLGWGRFGTANVASDGFGERTDEFTQTGGTARFDQYFRGPIGVFGGLSYQVTDRLTFKAEYSSDDYGYEVGEGIFERKSPWNYGIDYNIADGANITASYLYGAELGVSLNLTLNPKRRALGPGNEPAGVPVLARPSRSSSPQAFDTSWASNPAAEGQLFAGAKEALAGEGIELLAASFEPTRAEFRIFNRRYSAESQALGRTARVLARVLPASIETITLVPTEDGVPSSAVTFNRSNLESLANAPGRLILDTAQFTSGAQPISDELRYDPELYPRFDWSIRPYTEVSLFDPDNPVRGDIGVDLQATATLAPGLIASGGIRKRVIGNLDEITRESNSELPRVRSDFANYLKEGDPRIESLYLAYYARPGKDLYSRVTAGVLERMYTGVSGEVLWKPVDSRLGLGAELNYVQQRDFEGGFGLQDYTVATGHLSAYYQLNNGFHAQVDVGRYLAGDIGATFTLDREFDNGWRLGAFATFTDVPFDEFGEGSFDKGISITIPFEWLTGKPTKTNYTTLLKPLTRDGGARLNVPGRLYNRVRDTHQPMIDARSGRFWK